MHQARRQGAFVTERSNARTSRSLENKKHSGGQKAERAAWSKVTAARRIILGSAAAMLAGCQPCNCQTDQPLPAPVPRSDFVFHVDDVQVRMKYIQPGSFTIGSPQSDKDAFDQEKPQHRVTLTKAYWLGETEVTQALWKAVTGNNPSQFKGAQLPVEFVSWNDAQGFIRTLNTRVPGLNARLPTEAEWEYAARAGTSEPRYGEMDEVAWCHSDQTHPVGQKQPNPWGLYDMLGNVYEWSSDAFQQYQESPTTDPSNRVGDSHAYRGGGWYFNARHCRAAIRGFGLPDYGSSNYLGLRLARDPQ